jgi:hypothetical protein
VSSQVCVHLFLAGVIFNYDLLVLRSAGCDFLPWVARKTHVNVFTLVYHALTLENVRQDN